MTKLSRKVLFGSYRSTSKSFLLLLGTSECKSKPFRSYLPNLTLEARPPGETIVALTADRYYLKSECWPFHIELQLPLSWEDRRRPRETSLSTDASCLSLDCAFGFLRAGAYRSQCFLEDDSLKQEFHKQVHETL